MDTVYKANYYTFSYNFELNHALLRARKVYPADQFRVSHDYLLYIVQEQEVAHRVL